VNDHQAAAQSLALHRGEAKSIAVLVPAAMVGAYWVDPEPGENVTLFRVLSATFFLLFGGFMVYLIQQLKTAQQLSQRHEQQLELGNRELKHRIAARQINGLRRLSKRTPPPRSTATH